MKQPTLRPHTLALAALLSAMPVATVTANPDDDVLHVWVQVVPPHNGVVRAITEGRLCPRVRFDGRPQRMKLRAAPNPDFESRVCELAVPPSARTIEVAGRSLAPVPRRPVRVAVVGDTGCRMKAGGALDDGFQDCTDPDDWEFAKVAQQVADWKPDLIIQLGDYIYREQECPDGCDHCQNSPFTSPGMRMKTWEKEFFKPGRPMLEAAPIVLVRGDHEKCERAGRGFFRFMGIDDSLVCTDFSDPYALRFQGLHLVVMDTVQADDTTLSANVVINRYADDFESAARLARPGSWLMSHRPIWALRPAPENPPDDPVTDECKNQDIPTLLTVENINVTAQKALATSHLKGVLPDAVDLVLTAHIHVGEVLSFTGGRPPQMVVGISGTKLLPAVTEGLVGMEIDRETVTAATMISVHGFFGFEPNGRNEWDVEVLDTRGANITSCELADKHAACTP